MTCKDCNDTGTVTLFTSTQPCITCGRNGVDRSVHNVGLVVDGRLLGFKVLPDTHVCQDQGEWGLTVCGAAYRITGPAGYQRLAISKPPPQLVMDAVGIHHSKYEAVVECWRENICPPNERQYWVESVDQAKPNTFTFSVNGTDVTIEPGESGHLDANEIHAWCSYLGDEDHAHAVLDPLLASRLAVYGANPGTWHTETRGIKHPPLRFVEYEHAGLRRVEKERASMRPVLPDECFTGLVKRETTCCGTVCLCHDRGWIGSGDATWIFTEHDADELIRRHKQVQHLKDAGR